MTRSLSGGPSGGPRTRRGTWCRRSTNEIERMHALSLSDSGHITPPCGMRCASPSAIAVLPTARLTDQDRVVLGAARQDWNGRAISCSRPMTGSSLPSRASAVRSRGTPSAGNFDSGVASVTRDDPRTLVSASRIFSRVTPARCKKSAPSLLLIDEGEQQVLGREVLVLEPSISVEAASSSRRAGNEVRLSAVRPSAADRAGPLTSDATRAGSTPTCWRMGGTVPSCCWSRRGAGCSGVISWCWASGQASALAGSPPASSR